MFTNLCILFLSYFLETIGNLLVAYKTLQKKITNVLVFLGYTIALSVPLALLEHNIPNSNILYFAQAFFYIIGFTLCLIQSLPKALSLYIFTFIITGLVQYLMVIPTIVFPALTASEYYPLFALLTTIFICFIIYKWIPIERLYHVTLASDLVIRIIILNLYLFLMFGALYAKLNKASFYELFAIIFLFICTFLCINFDAIYTHTALARKDAELHAYQQYQPIVDSLIREIRMRQHNFDNAIQSFASLPLTCPDYESITSALNNYSKEAFHKNIELDLLKLNTRLVAGLLYSKMREAQHQRKILYVYIKNYALQTVMPEYLLMECIAILVDNAMEAVPEDSVISIQLSSQNGQALVEVKNPGSYISDALLKKMFEQGYTTKNDTTQKHGLGLPFLQKTIKQYNGNISCSNHIEDGINYITFKIIV